MRAGVYVYAAGSIAAGILDLIWGEFEAAHQPIQALSHHIPGREILAYIAAVSLVAGGAAILWRQTARAGAWMLGVIYLIFAVFWLPRFYTAPHALGFRIPLLIGMLAGVAQQLVLVAAAAIVYASLTTHNSAWRSKAPLLVGWTFGLSSIVFGLGHLTGVQGSGGHGAEVAAFGRQLLGDNHWHCFRVCRPCHTLRNAGCSGGATACADAVRFQRARLSAGNSFSSPQPHTVGIECLQSSRRGSRVDIR